MENNYTMEEASIYTASWVIDTGATLNVNASKIEWNQLQSWFQTKGVNPSIF